ncbi:MAG: outer membrane beta-barrel protein [Xanthomonadaceae bacterium]|jgi:outer membrane protein|nr:outer membrane beta-barrel protein [Xanthomonadaceae bacterium]
MNKISTALVLALALAAPGAASAEGFSVRLGYLNVNPDSDNGRLAGAYDVEVEYDWSATIGASYFVTGNIAIDVQTALAKFKHDLKLTGGATGLPTLNDANLVGVEHRPTTIQAQWHFAPGEQFGPYIGAGYGWTSISVARNQTGLGTLDTDRADGFTAEGGLDVNFDNGVFVRGSVQYLKFETDVTLGGAGIGTVEVNPWIYGVQVGYRF